MSSSGLPSTRSIKNKMTDSNFEPVKEENNIVECRACLEEINSDSTYYNLFDCVGQQEQMRSTIAEKLSNIAQIEISEADELPKVICDTCCSLLKTAHSFAVAVRKTDELLRQKFANIQKESENIWPKPIQISNNIIYTHYIPHMETKEEVLSEDECFAKQDSDEHNISKGEIKVESNSLDCEINTPKIDAGITVNCSILYCKNKNTKGGSINFMSFPKDPTIILKWLKHCKPNANSTNGRVCSIHFAASDYQRTMKQKIMNEHPERCRQIKPDAVPSLHLNPVFEIPPTDKGSENIMSYLEPDVFETDNNFNCPVVKVRTSEHDKERQPRKRRRESSPQSSETNSTEGFMIPVKVYKELLNYKSKYEHIKQKLLKIFTPGQISRLCSDNMNLVRWSVEDIAPAITLRSITPNGYSYLREVVGIPYPAFATLAQWTREFDIKEGVLDKIISLMKSKIKNFDSKQRIVVLSFNEISIWNQRETGNNSYGDYITCQCVMVRSLYGRWKQLIYYEFDQDMTADILKDLIQRMYDINLIVRAVTCDQGKGNPDLLNSLNIGAKSPQNTWFPHPANKNVRVHVFIDVPCLLKLARNNFVEHGFLYEDKLLTKETLVKFLEYLTVNDLKNIRNKLTLNHLNVDGPIKKSISAAAELFSNDTSVALEWCGNNGFLEDENLYEVSQVLKIFSEWFDIFNARIISEEDKKAFGQNFDHQFEVLETMNSLISSIKTGEKKNKLCFQRGIIISNKSLCNLFCDLQNLLGAEFEGILTSRLNLDLLNHFFSHIEDIDDNYVAGLSLKYRLKQYIIGKHSLESKSTSIYEDPDVPCLVIPLEIIETVKKTKSHATRCGAAAVRRLTDAASVSYI